MCNEIKIAQLENDLSILNKYLKYADGAAYYQDKEEIASIRSKLTKLKRESNGAVL